MKAKLNPLRGRIKQFRNDREEAKRLDAEVKKSQPELVAALKEVDPKGVGVVYDADDPNKGAAYVQQNNATEYWNQEAILDFLREPANKKLWLACSSRVLDVQKFEAAVANGDITPAIAKALKERGAPPQPFIRFGKVKEENL